MPWILGAILSIFLPLSGVYAYVSITLYRSFKILSPTRTRVTKFIIWSVVSSVNLLPIIFIISYLIVGRNASLLFGGEEFWIDLFLVYPFWFSLVITVQLFLVFLLTDIGLLIIRPIFKKNREVWLRRKAHAAMWATIVIIAYSIGTIISDTWSVRVREYEYPLSAQFEALNGFRIVQISDLQGDGRTTPAMLRDYVKQVNELHPDVVLFAGDLVTSGLKYVQSSADALGAVDARLGTYAVVGDHDIFSNRSMVVEALKENGVIVIEDSTIEIPVDSVRLEIIGITYTYRTRPSEDVLDAVANNHGGGFHIFLVHQPREHLVKLAASKGYNLFLAGHTHGGIIAFGIPGIWLWAPSRVETKYVSGFFQVGSMVVSVTNGLGLTLSPIRFHAPAEMTLVRLVR